MSACLERLRPRVALRVAGVVLTSAMTISTASATADPVVEMPIRVIAVPGWSIADAHLSLVDSSVQLSADPVALAGESLYRIRSCITARTANDHPRTECAERTEDTRGRATSQLANVPMLSINLRDLFQSGSRGHIAGLVSIDALRADGVWSNVASSWPVGGLPDATIAVESGAESAQEPPVSQGLSLPGYPDGGIDSGTRDSMCHGTLVAGSSSAPELSSDVLGELPFNYEVGEPTGTHSGSTPKGIMVLLHGGGWFMTGPGGIETLRESAGKWRDRGWRTVNATYRPCSTSIDDVLRLHDQVVKHYGNTLPLCVLGQSAGGHLALMVAARRPDVDCVIAQGAISDGAALAAQDAPGADGTQTLGPRVLLNWMTAAFGQGALDRLSPTKLAIEARVLYGIAGRDWIVPWEQATEFAREQRERDPQAYVETVRLEGGTIPWVHAPVSDDALRAWEVRELELVAPLVQREEDEPSAEPERPEPVASTPPDNPATDPTAVAADAPSPTNVLSGMPVPDALNHESSADLPTPAATPQTVLEPIIRVRVVPRKMARRSNAVRKCGSTVRVDNAKSRSLRKKSRSCRRKPARKLRSSPRMRRSS